jgi:hypothetical protein
MAQILLDEPIYVLNQPSMTGCFWKVAPRDKTL